MRRVLMWIAWNIPLGRLAPYVLGMAIGTKGRKIDDENNV